MVNRGKGFGGLIIVYLMSYLIFLIATWGSERLVWKCAITFENALKKKCFNSIFSRDFVSFSRNKNEEYLSTLTNNITSIEQDYLQPICALIKSALSVGVYVIVISVNTSPIICLFLIALSILATFIPKLYSTQLKKAGKEYVDGAAVYTKKVSDLLDGFALVDRRSRNAFVAENDIATDSLSQKRLYLGRKKVNGNTISGGTIYLIDIATFILCGVFLLRGHMTAGTVIAAITYAQSLTEPIQEILYDLNTLNASRDIVGELEEILVVKDDDEEYRFPTKSIATRDLRVAYPDKVLCYNADFSIGEKYVIVGESGSGKSTLLNAIMNRCEYAGDILIDDEKGRLDVGEVFYMNQNQHIFYADFPMNSTIFGTYRLADESILENVPLYDNVVYSADCSLLSGGEQQVVRICRMLSQEKRIILLDELFSAIDIENRRKIFHMLTDIQATIILVSHDIDFDKSDLAKWNIVRIEDICDEEGI